MTTKQKTIVGGLVAAVLVITAAGVSPFGWRVALTGRILRGQLPGVSWSDVAWEMRPFGGAVLVRRETGSLRDVNFLRKRTDGSPCAFLWETRIGSFWGRAEDRRILGALVEQLVQGNIYNTHDIAIETGDVVFDVGSHLGVFTRLALNAEASVVAIEPEPVNNTCFKQTFEKAIRDGRVKLVEAAAWHSKETLRFKVDQESWAGTVGERGDLVVQGLPIDDIVDDLKLDRVDLFKLDIEGAERHALNGSQRTMARFGPDLVVSVYHRPDDPQAVQQIVLAANPAYNLRESDRRDRSYYMNYFTLRETKSPQ